MMGFIYPPPTPPCPQGGVKGVSYIIRIIIIQLSDIAIAKTLQTIQSQLSYPPLPAGREGLGVGRKNTGFEIFVNYPS